MGRKRHSKSRAGRRRGGGSPSTRRPTGSRIESGQRRPKYRLPEGATTDNPHARLLAAVSVLLTATAGIGAWQMHGLARTACIVVVAFVVALPALAIATWTTLVLALDAFVPESPEPNKRRREGALPDRGRRERARRRGLALILMFAAAGITWYALSPDVGSYQLSTLLTLPLLVVVLVWLHRHLPRRVGWALALALAPVGPLGYLFLGGSQWWGWGRMTALPLVLLVVGSGARSRVRAGAPYRVPMDGPWGPP